MIKLPGFEQVLLAAILFGACTFWAIASIAGYMLGGDTYYDNKEACEAELKRSEHCINVYVKE